MGANDFVKGRTDNHLTFAMVDATDFATPESALSAAMKIKIYGKLRGATGVNFVTSGTGSLTNDIQHVGASVLGIYTIALAKADLSDASAAWYDQYITSLSATGAAYQVIVSDGGIDQSALLSRTLVIVSGASDAASAAQQGNSRLLVAQSYLSDIRSHLSDIQSDFQSRVPKRVATDSQLSNLISGVTSVSTSDLASVIMSVINANGVPLNASAMSDIRSAITAGATGLDASALSDIASAVVAAIGANGVELGASSMSDIRSAITAGAGLTASGVSDIESALASRLSDILSAAVQTNSRVLVVQSMASDAASAAQQANSRVLVAQSTLSDIYSNLSDFKSDFQSRVPAVMPAAKLTQHAAAVLAVVIGVGSTTTAVKLSTVEGGAPNANDDFYNGRAIVFTSGALAGQAATIADYTGATTTATVAALTGAPANAVTAVIA